MFVNAAKGARRYLDPYDARFLENLVNLAVFIRRQVRHKCSMANTAKVAKQAIFPSVITAFLIYQSDWGRHPVSRDKFSASETESLHGNNLGLLEIGPFWQRDKIKHENKTYCSFGNWRSFAVTFSDKIGFEDSWDEVLDADTWETQICRASDLTRLPGAGTAINLRGIVESYQLTEFDHHG